MEEAEWQFQLEIFVSVRNTCGYSEHKRIVVVVPGSC